MLQFFRKGLQGASIKFLIGILVLTFILWGIGDTLKYIGGEASYVLKVGDVEYSLEEWQRVVGNQKRMIQEKYGQAFSDEQLMEFGFFDGVLEQFIGKSLLLQEARALNVFVSDELVKKEIGSNKVFHGSDGKFSQASFKEFLKKAGIPEDKVIKNLKDEISTEYLTQPLTSLYLSVPQVVEQLNIAYNAIRDLGVYRVDIDKLPVVAAPKREELESILEKRKELFSTLEARSVSYLSFNKSNVDSAVTLSDAEIEEWYKSRVYLFTQPEKREISQLIFDDVSVANKAKKEIESGKSLKEVGALLKASNKNVVMGVFGKASFDSNLGDALFKASAQQVLEPIKAGLGYHVFQISKIIPQHVQELSEVKQELIELIRKEKIFERLYGLSQKLNTGIAGGKSITDLAEQYKLSIHKSVVTEQNVLSAHVKDVKDIERSDVFRATVFSTNQGQTSMVTPFQDDVFFVVHTDVVEPKRVKGFDEVKDELVKVWNRRQQEATASEIFEAIRVGHGVISQGDALEKYKKYVNYQSYKVGTDAGPISKVLPTDAISNIRKMTVGAFSDVYDASGNTQVMVKLNGIVIPSVEVLNKTKDSVRYLYLQHHGDDIIAQYINFLKKKYDVKVNKKLLERYGR
ncbi:hypothetical protein EDM53_03540 [Rickettsiales endosymbiont of Peranema trichophorum]|uniref:peptidylprolyl isomerase n=1 Tax=Rickettsiales endosymbiont of Peranema trichophorum TaxID=2486577 RepID=UPI001022A995|nr:peptidylprolyl isomerase [Rickettsiales endosymbiont of Peranema trichophorum]RZI46984.1 hypothetical protein EDM53_03540 [Rickettsiales endosymbiont of Peranema trichophorum]